MVPTIIFIVLLTGVVWLVVRDQGEVILEDLVDPLSLVAFALSALIMAVAFLLPEFIGCRISRGTVRLVSVSTFFGLCCVIFHGTYDGKALALMSVRSWRALGLAVLVLILVGSVVATVNARC